MPTPRQAIAPDGVERTFHCISRCVRRAFLCGDDPLTGRNFDHRKAWVKNRLQFLAGIFSIDVAGYAVMANHLHLVVRVRPDRAEEWSRKEVARRWTALFPPKPEEEEETIANRVKALAGDGGRIETLRARLSSISWFMRCLNEIVARKANREDDCKGRFWEGRFKCQALLDEAAILSCLAYVDLNPIRAKVAQTPEGSDFTSAQDRIVARQARRKKSLAPKALTEAQKKAVAALSAQEHRDAWLCPIEDRMDSPERGMLTLTQDQYLDLLDWTGRQLRGGKRGAIPPHLAPLLTRLSIDADRWLETVEKYGGWFRRACGCAERMIEFAGELGRCWMHGLNACKCAFGSPGG